eukprot:GGOE01000624.1.p1 GENE.GGOE01000624.1~~GGOE01000624.1.p1  ORF type:complete len:325 (-),score=69.88 GGOE01000624.1:200-1174(-)
MNELWLPSLLMCNGPVSVLLAEVLILAILIHTVLHRVNTLVLRWSSGKPWMTHVMANGRKRLKGMGVPPSDAAALRLWVELWGVALQHGVGALLCLPALTGGWGLPPGVPAVLARHAAVCECGWEVGDLVVRLHRKWFTPGGWEEQPSGLIGVVLLHHAMGFGLTIPMNIFFSESKLYFEMVAVLQGSSLFIILITQWGQMLDVSQPAQLEQMFWSSLILVLGLLAVRFAYYGWLSLQLLVAADEMGNPELYSAGVVAAFSLGLANAVYTLDAAKRLVKFAPLYAVQWRASRAAPAAESTMAPRGTEGIPASRSRAGWQTFAEE